MSRTLAATPKQKTLGTTRTVVATINCLVSGKFTTYEIAERIGKCWKTAHRHVQVLSEYLPVREEQVERPGKGPLPVRYWIEGGLDAFNENH